MKKIFLLLLFFLGFFAFISQKNSVLATTYCSGYNSSKGDANCYCKPVYVTAKQTACNASQKASTVSVTWNGANCLYCGYTIKWTDGNGSQQSKDYWVSNSDCNNKSNEISFFEKLNTSISDNNGIENVTVQAYGTGDSTTDTTSPTCPVPTHAPTPTPTPTITPTLTPTPTPTNHPTPIVTLSPTPIPTRGDITIHLEGIDQKNYFNSQDIIPTKESQGSNKTRSVTLYFYASTAHLDRDNPLFVSSDTVTQITNSTSPLFGYFRQQNFRLPDVTNGSYIVLVKVQEGSLIEYLTVNQTPIQIYNQGGSNVLVNVDNLDLSDKNLTYSPPTIPPTMRMGDIVTTCTNSTCSFNKDEILDYNALVDCYGNKITNNTCKVHNYPGDSNNEFNGKQYFVADLNGDGVVDGVDYTMLLKNYGDTGITVNLGSSKIKASIPAQPTPLPAPSPSPTHGTTPSPTPHLSPTNNPTPTGNQSALMHAKVLVIGYFPPSSSNNSQIDTIETGLATNTIDYYENTVVANRITAGLAFVTNATKYHGYSNVNAPPSIEYTLVDAPHFITEKMPPGHLADATNGTHIPNYNQILTRQNICDYVNNKGVKEVWVYGYHSNTIVPSESRMSSPRNVDVANDGQQETDPNYEYLYKMPLCSHTYILYNFNMGRSIESDIHDRMHQIENVMPYVEGQGKWPPRKDSGGDNVTGSLFWGSFSQFIQASDINGVKDSCGNAHFAPNWHAAGGSYNSNDENHNATNGNGDAYLYDLLDIAPNNTTATNCETWNPDSTKSTYVHATRDLWKLKSPTDYSYELAFYNWFMQNIPGANNGISYQGKTMRNWWEAMYDFDAFLTGGWSLLK